MYVKLYNSEPVAKVVGGTANGESVKLQIEASGFAVVSEQIGTVIHQNNPALELVASNKEEYLAYRAKKSAEEKAQAEAVKKAEEAEEERLKAEAEAQKGKQKLQEIKAKKEKAKEEERLLGLAKEEEKAAKELQAQISKKEQEEDEKLTRIAHKVVEITLAREEAEKVGKKEQPKKSK